MAMPEDQHARFARKALTKLVCGASAQNNMLQPKLCSLVAGFKKDSDKHKNNTAKACNLLDEAADDIVRLEEEVQLYYT